MKKNRKVRRSVAKGNEIEDFVPPPHAANISMMGMSNVGVSMLKNLRSFGQSVKTSQSSISIPSCEASVKVA